MLLLDYEFHPALGRYETLTSLDLFVTFQVASAPDHEIVAFVAGFFLGKGMPKCSSHRQETGRRNSHGRAIDCRLRRNSALISSSPAGNGSGKCAESPWKSTLASDPSLICDPSSSRRA